MREFLFELAGIFPDAVIQNFHYLLSLADSATVDVFCS